MPTHTVLTLDLSPDTQLLPSLSTLDGWAFCQVNFAEQFGFQENPSSPLIGLVIFPDCDDVLCEEVAQLLAQYESITWIALTPGKNLQHAGFLTLVSQYFYDFHTLPVDLQRLQITLGHARGMAALSHAHTLQQARNLQLDERMRLERQQALELEDAYRDLRRLAQHLQRIQEAERLRIAHGLHDELGQSLTALQLDLTALLQHQDSRVGEHTEHLESMLHNLQHITESMQRLCADLRPPLLDQLGFEAACEQLIQDNRRRTGIDIRYQADSTLSVNQEQGLALYRILQEALTNVHRHAHASRIRVSLHTWKDHIKLVVEDDGVGLPDEPIGGARAGLGLLGIRERAEMLGGHLCTGTGELGGARLLIRLPLLSTGRQHGHANVLRNLVAQS